MSVLQNGFNWFQNRSASLFRKPFSQLFLVGDGAPWVLIEEAREVHRLTKLLGIQSRVVNRMPPGLVKQCIFLQSPYALRELPPNGPLSNRIAFSYFHGRPVSQGDDFSRNFEIIKSRHSEICRVQVSCRGMMDLVLSSGIEVEKVRLIPIGVNLSLFPQVTSEKRAIARERLGFREEDIVIGSFQKDGEGWGNGDRPKLIKGPDVFVETVERIYQEKPQVRVLLTGPSRGYVKNELTSRNIPFKHTQVSRYADMSVCYHALDLMLVTSREEGGPKAVLESMACGIPLVSTKVGQAADLILHGENGWMVEVGDIEGLCSFSLRALELGRVEKANVAQRGRETAEANDYEAQLPLWRKFFENFIDSNV